ncbi:MAG: PAS domain S-box protein, partial [Bacteroidota bacterium]|nr:PAS domain S-box protein [Bacteroidota bacterium]
YEVHAYPSESGLSIYFKDITKHKYIKERELIGRKVLEMNAIAGNTLEQIVTYYLTEIEKLHEGMILSVLLVKGNQLFTLAAPQLPIEYSMAIDGIAFGKNVGSCGAAAYTKEAVYVSDIASDKRWANYKTHALAAGLKSCWSYPLFNTSGEVMATFAVYFNETKYPTENEVSSLENIKELLSIILENKFSELALKESDERYKLVLKATNDCVWDWNLITDEIFRSENNFSKLSGYKVSDYKNDNNFWTSRLHPDDVERVAQKLKKVKNNPAKKYWEDNYRLLKADGTYAFVYDRGYIIHNQLGKAIRMIGAMQDVSGWKKIEDELKNLSLIAKETVNGVIITDANGKITWINDGCTKICGYSFEEALNKNPGALLQGRESDPSVIDYMGIQIKSKQPFECEVINYHKDGKKYWVKIQGHPVFDTKGKLEGFFAIETDISRAKEEEQQLKILESVITYSNDGVLIAKAKTKRSLSYNTIFVNQAFSTMTGYDISEINGLMPGIFEGPLTDKAQIEQIRKSLNKNKPYQAEIINYNKNGQGYWIDLTLLPITDKAGKCTHWIFIQRDISLRKKHEEERELFIEELQHTNYDLKQFSFITSHNLRAPLSNLMGLVKLIDMSSITDPENKILITKFQNSTEHLNNILNDLMDVMVLKNTDEIPKDNVSISYIFEGSVATIKEQLQEVGGSISFDFSNVDEIIFNFGYLHIIFIHLLNNAIKYRSPKRSLEIKLETRLVAGKLELNFIDNGIGIDLERYGDRIFGMYQRFHEHSDNKGMGLFICKSKMKAMGGNITVTSAVDVGTTFTLHFKNYDARKSLISR